MDATITIIQGDSYNNIITIYQNDKLLSSADVIDVYFTCKKLNIQKLLVYDVTNKGWVISLSAGETDKCLDGVYSYDVTLTLLDSRVGTGIYNSVLTILPKDNEVLHVKS